MGVEEHGDWAGQSEKKPRPRHRRLVEDPSCLKRVTKACLKKKDMRCLIQAQAVE